MHTPLEFKPCKKIAVIFHHISFLCKKTPELHSPFAGLVTSYTSDIKLNNQEIFNRYREIRKLLPIYEKLVVSVLPFPKGEESSPLALERYERVQAVYDWWVIVESVPENPGIETFSDLVERHYRLIEVTFLYIELIL